MSSRELTRAAESVTTHLFGAFYLWTQGDRFALGFLARAIKGESGHPTCNIVIKGRFA